MKYILTFILLYFGNSVFAQDNNLEAYYRFINQAEVLITQNKLDSSAYYFAEAFKKKRHPFARGFLLLTIRIRRGFLQIKVK